MAFESDEAAYFYYETQRELQGVDAEVGTRLAAVYAQAVQSRPSLAEVVVQAVTDEQVTDPLYDSMATCVMKGHEIVVVVPVNPDHYHDFIDGWYAGRLAAAKGHVASVQGSVTPQDMINIVAGHELWHGFEAWQLAQAHGFERGAELFREQNRTALMDLPLGMATSDALALWRDRRSGYRRQLRKEGIDAGHFAELLRQNVAAYGQLPSESAGDDFSLAIMQRVYQV